MIRGFIYVVRATFVWLLTFLLFFCASMLVMYGLPENWSPGVGPLMLFLLSILPAFAAEDWISRSLGY